MTIAASGVRHVATVAFVLFTRDRIAAAAWFVGGNVDIVESE
jgi:hypothetical protein